MGEEEFLLAEVAVRGGGGGVGGLFVPSRDGSEAKSQGCIFVFDASLL